MPTVTEDISGALEGAGCYRRRDEAIRRIFPDFSAGWKAKIVLAGNLLEQAALNVFRLTVTDPQGQEFSKRLPVHEFAQIVAASNFKQRMRMSMLYYHAELRNYAVIGTANKNEHALGFFVKYGDGGVDIQLIAHLYKTQVYQLAKYLNVPDEIQRRTPTTDTYPGGSTQEEFFYRVPFDILDTVWLGHERGLPPAEIAQALDLSAEQVRAHHRRHRQQATGHRVLEDAPYQHGRSVQQFLNKCGRTHRFPSFLRVSTSHATLGRVRTGQPSEHEEVCRWKCPSRDGDLLKLLAAGARGRMPEQVGRRFQLEAAGKATGRSHPVDLGRCRNERNLSRSGDSYS